jgi:hypothetical protein
MEFISVYKNNKFVRSLICNPFKCGNKKVVRYHNKLYRLYTINDIVTGISKYITLNKSIRF